MNDLSDTIRPVDLDDAEDDEFTGTWATPWIVASLRRGSLFLLLAGMAEAIVWFGNIRLSGSSGGTVTNLFVATFGGALLMAGAMAVLAYVIDLVMYFNHCARAALTPQTVDG